MQAGIPEPHRPRAGPDGVRDDLHDDVYERVHDGMWRAFAAYLDMIEEYLKAQRSLLARCPPQDAGRASVVALGANLDQLAAAVRQGRGSAQRRTD
jgi:hypothetical protein